MKQPDDRPTRGAAVLEGARIPRLPRLIGLVLAAFVLVEGLLLGLGLLVTRALDDSSLNDGNSHSIARCSRIALRFGTR
ncbi:MAG TPA: hypothetical protein VIG96_11085 [Blastococcus sp.]|jgi:hypothetical protein